ncbi:MAG: hypothetical protein P9L99_20010 [Candidatus Lernaella stagnicola]|nr:hypothetical protein [Candidatus Lernaella stagnicola]
MKHAVKIMIKEIEEDSDYLDDLDDGLIKDLLRWGVKAGSATFAEWAIKDEFMSDCMSSVRLQCRCIMGAKTVKELDRCGFD